MRLTSINGKYLYFIFDSRDEEKYRTELSHIIIDKFRKKEDYNDSEIKEMIADSFQYYVDEFVKICNKQTNYLFYLFVLRLHENITDFALNKQKIESPDINMSSIALYRRILKCILECACDIDLVSASSVENKQEFERVLNELLFIGNMMFSLSASFAESSMIEGIMDVKFDSDNQYTFTRKPHFNNTYELIKMKAEEYKPSVTSEQITIEEFIDEVEKHFKFKLPKLTKVIDALNNHLKADNKEYFGIIYDDILMNFEGNFNYLPKEIEMFLQGLILHNNNKMSLFNLVSKPFKINRYLYKPVLQWTVDGVDYLHIGYFNWAESFIQFTTNCIPWGKAPKEWLAIKSFKKYMHTTEDAHDKVLEDALEEQIKDSNIYFDRNVKKLNNGSEYVDIDVKNLGEIDFVIIEPESKKIFILDCKNLTIKHDSTSQRSDYSKFVTDKKAYNDTLAKKITWFENNIPTIEAHFSIRESQVFSFSEYNVEGVFVIDTPTLYMYYSRFRIYTVDQFKEVVNNTYKDEIIYSTDDNGEEVMVSYPYFQTKN